MISILVSVALLLHFACGRVSCKSQTETLHLRTLFWHSPNVAQFAPIARINNWNIHRLNGNWLEQCLLPDSRRLRRTQSSQNSSLKALRRTLPVALCRGFLAGRRSLVEARSLRLFARFSSLSLSGLLFPLVSNTDSVRSRRFCSDLVSAGVLMFQLHGKKRINNR